MTVSHPAPSLLAQAILGHLQRAATDLSTSDLRQAVSGILMMCRAEGAAPEPVAEAIRIATGQLLERLATTRAHTSELEQLMFEIGVAGSLPSFFGDTLHAERLAHTENLFCRLSMQLNAEKIAAAGNLLEGAVAARVGLAFTPAASASIN